MLVSLHEAADIRSEPGMIHVAHHDVQVGVLRVVQVIDLANLDEFILLAEFADVSGLHIHDLRLRQRLLQDIGQRLGALARLHQLPGDEALPLRFRKTLGAQQPLQLGVADQATGVQQPPEVPAPVAYARIQRIFVGLLQIDLLLHQNPIVDAVVLDERARIDVLDVVQVLVEQIGQRDGFSGVHAPAHLRVIQIQRIPPEIPLLPLIADFRHPVPLLVLNPLVQRQ